MEESKAVSEEGECGWGDFGFRDGSAEGVVPRVSGFKVREEERADSGRWTIGCDENVGGDGGGEAGAGRCVKLTRTPEECASGVTDVTVQLCRWDARPWVGSGGGTSQ